MEEIRKAIAESEKETSKHEYATYSGVDKFRIALNGKHDEFSELEKLDFAHEERMSRELCHKFINEDGSYKYPPQLWASCLSNHILNLESWSNHFSIFITIMGVASAVFVLEIKEKPEFFATTILFAVVAAIVKWKIDKNLILKKKTVNRLNSFPPNNTLSSDALKRAG